MRFNKLFPLITLFLISFLLSACSNVSQFFRNRDFDYSRQKVTQNKPLEIPASVAKNPDIHPLLTLPDNQQRQFAENSEAQAQTALLPPNYDSHYNTAYLLQQQMMTVRTDLEYNKHEAVLVIHEPLALSLTVVEKTLQNQQKTLGVQPVKTDRNTDRILVKNQTGNTWSLNFKADQNNFRKTRLSLSDSDGKPLTGKAGNPLIQAIEAKISGMKITNAMLVASQFGFIHSKLGFKYQVYVDDKVASLVFVGNEQKIIAAVEKAIGEAGFSDVAYDQKAKTILFRLSPDKYYLIYIYDQTINGPLFSDMSNWHNLFRESQRQLRMSVFTLKQVLLPTQKALPILNKIAEALVSDQSSTAKESLSTASS